MSRGLSLRSFYIYRKVGKIEETSARRIKRTLGLTVINCNARFFLQHQNKTSLTTRISLVAFQNDISKVFLPSKEEDSTN